ncbi:GAF domain-containing protein [Hymenobacter sp. GOD-10R]|uniref:GAF domain-containing protein n=1 Tax=Hymenobacter sp. GOD-10R TaxID=3093922 RepID=UPI002D795F05|nr:GAF domain-containing protein [Hymenobacter sp. GOD-10R]WRQ31573.1 GAF domain-containing protein [Hymenobacter sp. GOD-10R]
MTPDSLLPADEAARLRSLHYYAILSSLHEAVFEELVRLTAQIFSLPISLIALVEAEEAIYIANQGLGDQERQPRVEALCSVAVRENKAVVFADLTTQPQQARVTAEALAAARMRDLQFYAGVPLRMPDQRTIGTLCVIDHQPRTFSAAEQQVLERISDLVAQTIAVRHYCLIDGLGEEHWQVMQGLLVEEIEELVALVRYLGTRLAVQIPVPKHVLDLVMQRLDDVYTLLREYYVSKRPKPAS